MANEQRLIDANALKRHMIKAMELANKPLINEDDVVYAIDNEDTVDAVPVVHAHWEDGYGMDHDGNVTYKSIDCSNCNEIFKIESHDREYWKKRFKACPFCGAIMDGGNEDA